MKTFSPIDLNKLLDGPLQGWQVVDGALERSYKFKDFSAMVGFLARLSLAQQEHNHHVAFSGVYNNLHLSWTTHDAGGITERDLKLAKITQQLATEAGCKAA